MMNKYLLTIGLVTSILFAEFDEIPYDWSGQYGVISNYGNLMWNQDWQIGVLLFDGSFSNYPTRFGTDYRNNFNIKNTAEFYEKIHMIPDSSQINSILNYYRGDYSYDQLELELNFEEKNSVISLNGFKRTYKGPYGQYDNPDGTSNPLQQSYRIDYISQTEQERLELSVGYFYTDSRLQLNDPSDFNHREKIVSTGLGYSREFGKWLYNAHGALFQEYYKMSYDSTQSYLNRIHLNQCIKKQTNSSSTVQFGIEIDNQGLTDNNDFNINRTWSTLYSGWNNKFSHLKIGTTFAKSKVVPYISFINSFRLVKIGNLKTDLSYSAKPRHIYSTYKAEDSLEKWTIADINGNFNFINIPINLNLYFANTDAELNHKYYLSNDLIEFSENLISTSLYVELPFIRNWKVDLKYRHIFEHNFYSDGVGNKIYLGLNISERLFKNKMEAILKFWADGYLQHTQNLDYEGFHYGPYMTDNTQLTLPDFWVANLDFSVKVAKMTIGWKVYNILKTIEPVTDQVFPDLNEKYLLISNSNNFPPMSRFVTLNIIWEFEN